MSEIMDVKEDGEIDESNSEQEVYTKLTRPHELQHYSTQIQSPPELYESDSSSSSDSDGETPTKKLKTKRLQKLLPTASSASRSKNGALWRNILQEETLMENLKSCDVSSSRKRKFERGAETYDFKRHRVNQSDIPIMQKRRKFEFSGNDSSSDASSKSRKFKKARYRKNKRNKQQRDSSSRLLDDLTVPMDSCKEDFASDLATKLREENSELILRTVCVIGKEASLELFRKTQQIEKDGGMLTIYKNRRRTPGGIFLFLLKSSNDFDEKQKKEIFDAPKYNYADGKKWQPSEEQSDNNQMQEQEEITNPPPSPIGADVNENSPDIGLVSQKILSMHSSKENEDVTECDYVDMETF